MRPNLKCISATIDYDTYLKLKLLSKNNGCTISKSILALVKIFTKNTVLTKEIILSINEKITKRNNKILETIES